ncbi:hypothetical protein SAMN06265375_10478 [Muriicola jejuensis]|uniref:Uncharacterized protein n=1 Tax=Muriicola jejuensis TaxID=504488 RepID=A0A6P0UJ34_9FLAO|nr:hypothetical protein [Muriicola jejuensis]NER11093.1 hypothetical protein [Muriicola jejuensis]SMP23645.1 hypothetical protein SAMN06265375_10478 [Muriicola jejuensis]
MAHSSRKTKVFISSCREGKKEILGVDQLIKKLEREYFSRILIRNSTACCEENNLVIEMECPLGLHEMLFHMQQGAWGSYNPSLVCTGLPLLNIHMQEIRELNGTFIDVEELSIQLKDCTIVIKKIAPESVENQLDAILMVLAEHYVHITREMTMTPMEIFVPVYEEVKTEDSLIRLVGPKKVDDKGYYFYWGLYFEEEEEAMIYDLKNKVIIPGDLDLLDQ